MVRPLIAQKIDFESAAAWCDGKAREYRLSDYNQIEHDPRPLWRLALLALIAARGQEGATMPLLRRNVQLIPGHIRAGCLNSLLAAGLLTVETIEVEGGGAVRLFRAAPDLELNISI